MKTYQRFILELSPMQPPHRAISLHGTVSVNTATFFWCSDSGAVSAVGDTFAPVVEAVPDRQENAPSI
jgi:hypothetical protein